MARFLTPQFGRRSGFYRHGRLMAMSAGLGLAALLWWDVVPGLSALVHRAESALMDGVAMLVEPAPEREDFVFLGIDDASLTLTMLSEEQVESSPVLPQLQEQWPWNRRVWAEAIHRLGEAGANQIVLDILFPVAGRDLEADRALAEAIAKYRKKVVLGAWWGPLGEEKSAAQTMFVEPHQDFLGKGEGDETAYGFTNVWKDSADGVVRDVFYRMSMRESQRNPELKRLPGEDVFDSLSAVIGRRMGVEPPEEPKRLRYAVRGVDIDGDRYRDITKVYRPVSLYKLFFEETWETDFRGGEFFKDKVVIIGPVSPFFHDKHPTPSGVIDGAQFHLQAAGCLVSGAFLNEAPPYWHWVGLLGMALVGGLLVLWVRNPVVVFLLAVVGVAVWLVGVVLIANETSMLTGGFAGVLGLSAVVLSGESFEFLTERIERGRLFGQLSRSVSRDVAAAMVRSPDGYLDSAKGGRRRIVVLFSDVRNFTERSERENPEALVAQLNEYLTRMVGIIFANGGTLDKFIGDAIMATWGGIEDRPPEEIAAAALKAAGEMRDDLQQLNEKWDGEGRERFEAGIGMHIGEAVVGEVGSRERSDFTAIGDAVNLASRIEGMTKMLQVPILVSGEVAALQADREQLCSLGRFRVKGRREPVEVVAALVKDKEAFLAGLAGLGRKDFVAAEGALLEVAAGSELSGPAKFYLRQMEVWKRVAPEEWDGVVTLESK